ncbi:hypothetical protein ACH492_27940 [Streptomyces sp. NPDC019443]|uniref:hypothetical protein n=1 Tax=Streptomyces sp. NPDC019443 TaxID=3365061 RepID=UPI003790A85F
MIEPFLPIGGFGPYPERLRQQFEGAVWRFRKQARRRHRAHGFRRLVLHQDLNFL